MPTSQRVRLWGVRGMNCEEYCRAIGESKSVFELEQLVRGYPFQGGTSHPVLVHIRNRYAYLSLLRIREIACTVWSEMYREHAAGIMDRARPTWLTTVQQKTDWASRYSRAVELYIDLLNPNSLAARREVQPMELFT
jgi:hypothetical protein